jgi:hypothetical protein
MPDLYGGGNVIYPYIKGRLQFRTCTYRISFLFIQNINPIVILSHSHGVFILTIILLLITAPYTNVTEAYDEIKQTLEAGPHDYGANVTVELDSTMVQGFDAEPLPAWFRNVVDKAAAQIYNQGDKSFVDSGVGGTIGFLSVIQDALKGMLHHCFGLISSLVCPPTIT